MLTLPSPLQGLKILCFIALIASLSGPAALAATKTGSITLEDSVGLHHFSRIPTRIAVLNWDLAEQLLELDVTPIAMPDIPEYNNWVARPPVPATVADLGSRIEPNLEKLARLKPDLIIIASPQLDQKARLEQIAPVLFFQTYSAAHNNPEAAINTYRQLARLLDRSALAEQKLAHQEHRLQQLGDQLRQSCGPELPSVATLRFASTTSVYLYGDNSISQYALQRLGIRPALPQPVSQWGVVQTRLIELSKITQGAVLYFKPFSQEAELKQSPLWRAMPFVQQGRVNSVEPAWSYGGAMSIGYMAEVLTRSLLEICQPEKSES